MTNMNNNIQYHWFYLNDTTYLSINEKTALLYRIDVNKRLIINNLEIVSYLSKFEDVKNMGVISVPHDILQSDEMVQLLSSEFGFVVPEDNGNLKPAKIPQICKINIDYDKRISGNEDVNYQLQMSNISKNLVKLAIFLNDDGKISTTQVDYSKRFDSMKKIGYMDFRLFSEILSQVSVYPINTIDLCGSGAILHPYFGEIVSAIHNIGKQVRLIINYDEITNEVSKDVDNLSILVNGGFNPVQLNRVITTTNLPNSRFFFRAMCLDDIDVAECFIEAYDIDCIIVPFFDGQNAEFVQSIIAMDSDDIFSRHISRREIFRNQKLNSNLFGRLYILPNGDVFSSLINDSIGNCRTDKISKIIFSELSSGTIWRKTRNDVSCSSCIYKYLCPPPSEYEISMDYFHMCSLNM